MSKRHRIQSSQSFSELDSFMDIVTNVIGALFFVIIYVVIASFGASGRIVIPPLGEAETEAVFFDCRSSTAYYAGIDEILEEAEEFIEDKSETMAFSDLIELLGDQEFSNDFFTMNFDGLDQRFTPIPEALGETTGELMDAESEFRKALQGLDPEEHHLFFFVRPSSFEVFHTARSIAYDAGFKVGWEPWEEDAPIVFSSSGGKSTSKIPI